jgi:hypothetical protein
MFHAQNRVIGESLGHGYLYNSFIVSEANFLPNDFVLPSVADCDILKNYLSITDIQSAFNQLAENDAAFNYWEPLYPTQNNVSGLTVYGSGTRYLQFQNKRQQYFFRTSDSSKCYILTNSFTGFHEQSVVSELGASVRALYTGVGTPTSVTDNDGNIYDVVQIGTQYWTLQNWKCTTLDNGDPIPNVTNNASWAALTTLGRCAYDNDENNV